MIKTRKMCFDKLLPSDLTRPNRVVQTTRGHPRAIAIRDKRWINGSNLKIHFLSGTDQQKSMVRQIAPIWADHANLTFEFTDDPAAQIRVTFDPSDGAWSYVGTDNSGIRVNEATLNLGWQDQGVILHEFGHMIGLSHEHQNPDGGLQWNEEVVLRELAGPPNFWSPEVTRHNVLNKYSADILLGTEFDPNSVMLYEFPAQWTLNGVATHGNDSLSDIDKEFVKSKKMYPSMDPADQRAVNLELGNVVHASINENGEEDLYKLRVTTSGVYTVETHGATDVVLAMYGPDNQTALIAEDDDSGDGNNALVEVELGGGEYYVQVKHFSENKTGDYDVLAFRS